MKGSMLVFIEISRGLDDFPNERSYYDMQIYKTIKNYYLGITSRNQNKIESYNSISVFKRYSYFGNFK